MGQDEGGKGIEVWIEMFNKSFANPNDVTVPDCIMHPSRGVNEDFQIYFMKLKYIYSVKDFFADNLRTLIALRTRPTF